MKPFVLVEAKDVEGSAAERQLFPGLAKLLESGVVGLVVWDVLGRIHEANEHFLNIVGYSREDLVGGCLRWNVLSPPERHAADQASVEQLKKDGLLRGDEREFVRRDGTRVFVRLHSTLGDDGLKAFSIAVDVSEQRKVDTERLWLMERERQARAEAECAVHSRDDILAIVSHDLRNPLSIIAMSANILEQQAPDPGSQAQLGIIRRAVSRMTRLIGDLLDVTQIASGGLRISAEPLEVAAICDEARHMFGPLLSGKNQSFDCTLPVGPLIVSGDRDRISQVLSNLVDNAHKFTPEGGRVELRVEAVEGFARFAVADTGPGISKQDLPHLFDRFWQARRVRRGGVGLGLSITKGIVEAHGGSIRADSVAGMGTTFFFTIPALSQAG